MKRDVTDSKIDSSSLDYESTANVELLKYWNKQIAVRTKERDKAKSELKRLEGQIRLQIERNPQKFRIDRVNDKLVEALFYEDPRYILAQESYTEASYQLSKAFGYKEVFQERSTALDRLLKLFLANYYIDVRNNNNRPKESSDEANDIIDKALKRRKKV